MALDKLLNLLWHHFYPAPPMSENLTDHAVCRFTELSLVVTLTLTIVLIESSSIHSHMSHASLYLARQ